MTVPVDIVGASCVFPSGPTLPLADCALRSQIALLNRHPTFVDQCGAPARASYFPVSPYGFDAARWSAIACLALAELAERLAAFPVLLTLDYRLWLVLPRSARAGVPEGVADMIINHVQDGRIPWTSIKPIRGEHAIGVHAVRKAWETSRESGVVTVVLAVDGWLNSDAMAWLEGQRLLHGARTRHEGEMRSNPYGKVPGEGAAAVALCRPGTVPAPLAQLLGAAMAEEKAVRDGAMPCLGLALTQAAQDAAGQPGKPVSSIGRISSDLTAEPFRADEFGFTTLRMSDWLLPGWTRTTPASVSGDIGAATSIAHLALASYGMQRWPSPQAARQLILCSSDDPLRGAMVIGPSTC